MDALREEVRKTQSDLREHLMDCVGTRKLIDAKLNFILWLLGGITSILATGVVTGFAMYFAKH